MKTTAYSQLFYDLNSVLTLNVLNCQRVLFDFLAVTTLLILKALYYLLSTREQKSSVVADEQKNF